jgi:hypothetical protein
MRAALSVVLLAVSLAAPADDESGRQRVVEIRSYNLKPGTVDTFERLFLEEARPLLVEWDIDVVAYGRSLHDENSWFLIRSFDDSAQRERVESAFYGSVKWREGPRDPILECIESYTTLVLPFGEETVAQLRRSLRVD